MKTGRDVLVVGGGPAGLATAIALSQRGLSVTVADARMPPFEKACGEGLMPDARMALAWLGVWLDSEDGAEFAGIRFVGDGGIQATARFSRGAGLGVRRMRLQERLEQRARAVGAELCWGTRVGLNGAGSVDLDGARAHFGWIVGADGQASQVRSWAGLDSSPRVRRRYGFRRRFRVRPWSEFVEVHWGAFGQAYVTPVGREEVCVATVSHNAAGRWEGVLAGLPGLKERLSGAEATAPERGAVTTMRKLHRVVRGRVALVGDASGSVDAVTGEGMAVCFRQAHLLAEALEGGELNDYAARHQETLKRPRSMARVLLAMDGSARLRSRALRMLAARPEVFRGLLAVHLGDQSAARFALSRGWEMGWGMLAAHGDAS